MDTSLNIAPEIENNSLDDEKLIFELSSISKKLEAVSTKTKSFLKKSVSKDDKLDNSLLEKYQFQSHGLAWFETYVVSLRETLNWYKSLCEKNKQTNIDKNILHFAFSEYLTQLRYGVMMSQSEIIRKNIREV